MYIMFNEIKYIVNNYENNDNNLLLVLSDSNGVGKTYDDISKADKSKIVLMNDEDTEQEIFLNYTNIENFIVIPNNLSISVTLSKIDSADFQTQLNNLTEQLTETNKRVDELEKPSETFVQQTKALSILAKDLDDATSIELKMIFPEWDSNSVTYVTGDKVRYNEKLYKTIQTHVSQQNWAPGQAPSLFVEIPEPGVEYPEWKQPSGAHDAYKTGDKVSYKGKKYISKIDNNTWSPDQYPAGWEEIK